MAPYRFAIELTPSALRHIVDGVADEKYTDRLSDERFTLVEVVAHVADFEVIFLDRMTLAHESPGSTVVAFDEGQRAIEKRYAERDIQHELDVFENRRRDTVEFLKTLSEEDLNKTIIHPEWGELSIKDQINFLQGHDLYHLEQAGRYLR
jgi:uncharacterized damage-inducible protein DinB